MDCKLGPLVILEQIVRTYLIIPSFYCTAYHPCLTTRHSQQAIRFNSPTLPLQTAAPLSLPSPSPQSNATQPNPRVARSHHALAVDVSPPLGLLPLLRLRLSGHVERGWVGLCPVVARGRIEKERNWRRRAQPCSAVVAPIQKLPSLFFSPEFALATSI